MDLLSTTYSLSAAEAAQKMGHLIQLRATVQRAKAHADKTKSYRSSVLLQRAQRDLEEFSSTMRPRLVA